MKRTNTILAAAFLVLLFAMAGYTLQDLDTIRTDLKTAWEQREDKTDSSLTARLEFTADQTEGLLNAERVHKEQHLDVCGNGSKDCPCVETGLAEEFVGSHHGAVNQRQRDDKQKFVHKVLLLFF